MSKPSILTDYVAPADVCQAALALLNRQIGALSIALHDEPLNNAYNRQLA